MRWSTVAVHLTTPGSGTLDNDTVMGGFGLIPNACNPSAHDWMRSIPEPATPRPAPRRKRPSAQAASHKEHRKFVNRQRHLIYRISNTFKKRRVAHANNSATGSPPTHSSFSRLKSPPMARNIIDHANAGGVDTACCSSRSRTSAILAATYKEGPEEISAGNVEILARA